MWKGLISLKPFIRKQQRWYLMTGKILQMLSAGGLSIVLYTITDEDMEQYIRQGNSRLKIIALPIEADLEELL